MGLDRDIKSVMMMIKIVRYDINICTKIGPYGPELIWHLG